MSSCPFSGARELPADSTPLTPSSRFADWRGAAAAVPLSYRDGHEGLLVTRHDEVRAVLTDARFSQQPQRMPSGEAQIEPGVPAGPVDGPAQEATGGTNILGMDGAEHLRLRRAVTRRFSVRSARGHRDRIAEIVAEQLDAMVAAGPPADLLTAVAEPVSIRVHALVLGVPDHLLADYARCFVAGAPRQDQHDVLRAAIAWRTAYPGEDVLSDLLAHADLGPAEVEGLAFVLSVSGRDTVAFMISTGTAALLADRPQYEALVAEPERVPAAVEEIVRYCTMFLTLFPRTATEPVQIGDVVVPAGTTVSVSAVSANRDERRWDHPDRLDVHRDARGHLAFGDGPHGCVGQQLARVELAEAFTALVTRLPGLRLLRADVQEPQPLANPVATYAPGEVLVAW